ncbi:MAG: class I SAM-dependent methyltransferase [Candidatus Roizmanbacteria bacterium]|nr:class I SAM-dependent methyltransferase [Candidatus Roizmanbacteria bacterium]
MKKITSIIKAYLAERPDFYAYLRPQEAYFFYERKKQMKSPILDFGSGDGFFASTIFKKRFIDVGLDLSSSRIAESLKTNMYKEIKIYDGVTIPFASQTFRTIISNCVFEHIPKIGKSVKEMHRVLKKNGLLMTTVMCSSWSTNLHGGVLFGKKYIDWFNNIQHHDSLLSKEEWVKLFKKSGFEIVESIDYLYEVAAKKTELYHFLSLSSLVTYGVLKKWKLFPFVSEKKIREIKKIISEDNKNPSACFFVLKKI